MKSNKSCDVNGQMCYTWEINDSSEVGRYTPFVTLLETIRKTKRLKYFMVLKI